MCVFLSPVVAPSKRHEKRLALYNDNTATVPDTLTARVQTQNLLHLKLID